LAYVAREQDYYRPSACRNGTGACWHNQWFAAKVDHRVGLSTFDLGGFEHDELARLETHRARQSKLEMDYITREFVQRVNVAGSMLRRIPT
jgi:hypothetical protein